MKKKTKTRAEKKIKPVKAWAIVDADRIIVSMIFSDRARADIMRIEWGDNYNTIPVLIVPLNPKTLSRRSSR